MANQKNVYGVTIIDVKPYTVVSHTVEIDVRARDTIEAVRKAGKIFQKMQAVKGSAA